MSNVEDDDSTPAFNGPLRVSHVEIYRSRNGETIKVRCRCALRRDHDYATWVYRGRPREAGPHRTLSRLFTPDDEGGLS